MRERTAEASYHDCRNGQMANAGLRRPTRLLVSITGSRSYKYSCLGSFGTAELGISFVTISSGTVLPC